MAFFFFLLLIQLTSAQLNFSSFSNYPNYTAIKNNLLAIGLNDNPLQIFILLNETGFPIVRMDVSQETNIYEMGRYVWNGTQISEFTSMYFVEDFLIASSSSQFQFPKIFRISTFQSVGSFSLNCSITSGVYLSTSSRFVFGTTYGNAYYFETGSLPIVNIVQVKIMNMPYSTFISKSPGQQYVSVTYKEAELITFYQFNSSWPILINSFNNSAGGVYSVVWTNDGRYALVFPFNMPYVLVYDRVTDFGLHSNKTFFNNIRNCFSYPETNSFLCISPINSSIMVTTWPSLIPTILISRDAGRVGAFSSDKRLLTHYDPTLGKAYFYIINPPCSAGFFLNSIGNCQTCASNCFKCQNSSYCNFCVFNHQLIDGLCQYNSSASSFGLTCGYKNYFTYKFAGCAKCQLNCHQCLSGNQCQTCSSGFYLVNGTCRPCPADYIKNFTTNACVQIALLCPADKYYNISSAQCVQCQPNCAQCNSTTQCQTCSTNFVLFNGTCQPCPSKTFYNSTTLLCNDCSSKCLQCSSSSTCSLCEINSTLTSGVCIPCSNNTFYNTTSRLCDDITNFCTGDQYFSITLARCVQCQMNCVQCLSTTACRTCSFNFSVVNGACESCPSKTFYNSTTLLCDNCLPHCVQCNSSSTCTTCASNYNFVHSPSVQCITCPLGSFFNSLTQSCQSQCVDNCLTCLSYDSCSVCKNGYDLTPNKTCLTSINQQNDGDANSILDSQEVFSNMMDLTLENEIFQGANKIPGSRVMIYHIFGFVINIDHLWLYICHKRQYSTFISNFFGAIQKLESQKWNSVSNEFLNSKLSINFTQMGQRLNFKKNQTSWKFLQIQGHSRSFLLNNLQYFCMNVPFVMLMFLGLKFLFNLLIDYKISIILREYSFNFFLIIMLMEGNLESFTYYFISDCAQLTGHSFFEKALNALTLVFFMIFIVHIFGGYAFVKLIQGNNSGYFFNNYQINFQSLIHISLQTSIFDFLLGMTHLLMENDYKWQLKLLFTAQMGYLLLQIRAIRSKHVYRFKYIEWQNMLASVIRVCLILIFNLDQDLSEEETKLFDQIQLLVMILYLMNWMLSIVINLGLLFLGIFNSILDCLCNKNIQKRHVPSEDIVQKRKFLKKERFSDLKPFQMHIGRVNLFQISQAPHWKLTKTDHGKNQIQGKKKNQDGDFKRYKNLKLKKNIVKIRNQQCQSRIEEKEESKDHKFKQKNTVVATYSKKLNTREIKSKFYDSNLPLKLIHPTNSRYSTEKKSQKIIKPDVQQNKFQRNQQQNAIQNSSQGTKYFNYKKIQNMSKFMLIKDIQNQNGQTIKYQNHMSYEEPTQLRLSPSIQLGKLSQKKNSRQRNEQYRSDEYQLDRSQKNQEEIKRETNLPRRNQDEMSPKGFTRERMFKRKQIKLQYSI